MLQLLLDDIDVEENFTFIFLCSFSYKLLLIT